MGSAVSAAHLKYLNHLYNSERHWHRTYKDSLGNPKFYSSNHLFVNGIIAWPLLVAGWLVFTIVRFPVKFVGWLTTSVGGYVAQIGGGE